MKIHLAVWSKDTYYPHCGVKLSIYCSTIKKFVTCGNCLKGITNE